MAGCQYEIYIDIPRLLLLWRIMTLSVQCIYKKILISRFVYVVDFGEKCGPLYVALNTAKKYNLLNTIISAVEFGTYMSMEQWKRCVKERVIARENTKWSVQSTLYPSVSLAKGVMNKVEVNAWWKYIQVVPSDMYKCISVVRLLLGVGKLNTSLYRFKDNTIASPLCNNCESYTEDTAIHMLFQCDGLKEERKTLWQDVLENCPTDVLRNEIVRMRDIDCTKFLLSCLSNTFVLEWIPLYKSICKYVYNLYHAKQQMN